MAALLMQVFPGTALLRSQYYVHNPSNVRAALAAVNNLVPMGHKLHWPTQEPILRNTCLEQGVAMLAGLLSGRFVGFSRALDGSCVCQIKGPALRKSTHLLHELFIPTACIVGFQFLFARVRMPLLSERTDLHLSS